MLARACVLFGALLILPGAMANAQTGLGSRPLIRRPVTQTPPAGQPPAALSMTERTNWVRRFLHREVTLEPLTLRFSLGSDPREPDFRRSMSLASISPPKPTSQAAWGSDKTAPLR